MFDMAIGAQPMSAHSRYRDGLRVTGGFPRHHPRADDCMEALRHPPGERITALTRYVAAATWAAALLALAVPTSAQIAPSDTTAAATAATTTDREGVVRPGLTPVRISEDQRPRLDGVLDDPAWVSAPAASNFLQQRPNFGQAPSQPTEIRIVYTDKALFFGIRCYDDDPSTIVHQVLGRDALVWDDDYVIIVLDTFGDKQNGFFFQTNPNGVRRDAVFRAQGSAGQFNDDWDGVWKTKATITSDGWQAEIEIPWRTLRFPASDIVTMGLNIERQRRSVNEQSFWSLVDRQFNSMRVSQAGTMAGLQGIRPGFNLSLRPYGLVRSRRGDVFDSDAWSQSEFETKTDVGLDLKWGLTSNITLDLTVNTDFAQVELDDQRVNLTRFPLLFPEKREFFLENRDLFTFGSPGNRPFFSRRIGLDMFGDVVPMRYGARVTGKLGRTEVGLMDVMTDEVNLPGDESIPRQRFDVMRLSQDVGYNSRIGGLAVARSDVSGDAPNNYAYGVDADVRPSDYLDLAGYAVQNEEEGLGPDRLAWGGRARYARRLYNATLFHERIGRDYEPRVGFVPRNDVNQTVGEVAWTPEPNLGPLRRIEAFLFGEWITRRDGIRATETRWAQASLYGNGEQELSAYYYRTFDRLFDSFELSDTVTYPAGDYEFDRVGAALGTDPSKMMDARVEAEWGDYFDGTLSTYITSVRARAAPHFTLSSEWEVFDVKRFDTTSNMQQTFFANVLRLRLRFDFSNALRLSVFSQWNSASNLFLSQLRLHYVFGNESDFFIVFTDGRADDSLSFAPRRQTMTVKLSYHIWL